MDINVEISSQARLADANDELAQRLFSFEVNYGLLSAMSLNVERLNKARFYKC